MKSILSFRRVGSTRSPCGRADDIIVRTALKNKVEKARSEPKPPWLQTSGTKIDERCKLLPSIRCYLYRQHLSTSVGSLGERCSIFGEEGRPFFGAAEDGNRP